MVCFSILSVAFHFSAPFYSDKRHPSRRVITGYQNLIIQKLWLMFFSCYNKKLPEDMMKYLPRLMPGCSNLFGHLMTKGMVGIP